ncbi:SRPBCC domain-containing protein [Streptomyces sp. NPDC004290]
MSVPESPVSAPSAVGRAGGLPPEARHDTFTVESRQAASPGAVFGAFADIEVRRRWFRMPGRHAEYRHDFRVGGGEAASSEFPVPDAEPERLAYASTYLAITPDARIVFAYTSTVNDVPRWSSLVTVELRPEGDGTRLRWTEQAVFLTPSAEPAHDLPHLRGATRLRLNGLPAALAAGAPPGPTA